MMNLTFPVTADGLAVPVWVGLDADRIAGLVAAGRPVPGPIQVRGIVDTGANVTGVAAWVLRQLGISAATTASTTTAGGVMPVGRYRVFLEIADPAHPGGPWLTLSDVYVMDLPTNLPDTDVLIGLDVLLTCKLVLDGPARHFSREF